GSENFEHSSHGDRAGPTDGEHAAELQAGQGELGGAPHEPELDAKSPRAPIDQDRPGDHANTVAIRDQLDAIGGELADPGDAGRQAPCADHDPAQPAWSGAAVTGAGALALEAACQACEIGVTVAIDLE